MGVTRCTCIGMIEPHVVTGRPSWRELVADPSCPCVRHRADYTASEPTGQVGA